MLEYFHTFSVDLQLGNTWNHDVTYSYVVPVTHLVKKTLGYHLQTVNVKVLGCPSPHTSREALQVFL